MLKYRRKSAIIEAITFDELVEYGLSHGANIVDGVPWSFVYKGHHLTHDQYKCYMIPVIATTLRMTPEDMLITGAKGEIYPCNIEIFKMIYETMLE